MSSFKKGQIICSKETGIKYKVLREYVPPKPGYYDLNCFELIRVTPLEPFLQASSTVERFYVTDDNIGDI